jgi:hypothetical protein
MKKNLNLKKLKDLEKMSDKVRYFLLVFRGQHSQHLSNRSINLGVSQKKDHLNFA